MEEKKADLLRGLAAIEPALLSRKPDPATWSILQVIAHVIQSETGTLRYIQKKTQNPDALSRAGLLSRLRVGALVVGFRSPFKFKAPKALAEPPSAADLREASLGWAEIREDWREFIESFPSVLEGRLIFRHPVVGLLGPADTMAFMDEHLANHIRQIGRIRKALDLEPS